MTALHWAADIVLACACLLIGVMILVEDADLDENGEERE
jgi:hypothetical protein